MVHKLKNKQKTVKFLNYETVVKFFITFNLQCWFMCDEIEAGGLSISPMLLNILSFPGLIPRPSGGAPLGANFRPAR
jgi:hypothetical protein